MHRRRGWGFTPNRKVKGLLKRQASLAAIAMCTLAGVPASASASPPIATTEAATAVSYEQAMLKGKVTPEGSATSYWFEYGETTAYGTKLPVSPESVGSGTSNVSVSKVVTGLSQSTTYHFRVVAESEVGTAKGEDATFKTAGFEFEFGEPGSGNGQLSKPFGIAVDSKGNAWVSDTGNNRIEEFSEKGEYLSQFGKEGTGNGEFKSPKGIAIDSEDHIWVVDSGNDAVQEFNSKGEYLSKFGKEGISEGEFQSPTGIDVVGAGPNIFIADTGNNRVQKFSQKGKWLATIGKEGTGNGELKGPQGVTVLSAIWVADTGNNRVQKFNSTNFKFGSKVGEKGSGEGQFKAPTAIVEDFQEKVWVVDSGNNRAEKFDKEGKYLDQIGKEGIGPGQLVEPIGIAAPAAQKLLILDAGNDRVEGWTVRAEPPDVFTAPATGITPNSMTLHATINPEALATAYWFEYGETESYGTKIPITPESIGSGLSNVQVEQVVTGLAEGTVYHFRAVAENEAGISKGIDRKPKTLKLPKVTTEAATAIKASQATLKGKVNPEGSATSYWFEYGETTSYGTKIPASAKSVGSGTEYVAVSQTPTGLKEGTTYHFRVVAESEADPKKEVSGEDKAFTTLKLPKVTTEAATEIILTQATLNGKVNPEGSATSYWFEYGETTSYGTKIPASPKSIGSGTEYVVVSQTPTGLKGNATYHFRVVGESEAGISNGEDKTFKALPRSSVVFGTEGKGKGEFKHPADIAIDAEGNAWVVDMENDRLEKFDKEGKYITKFGESGSGKCQLNRPKSVAIDSEGYLWVDDAGNYRVQKFNEAGECFLEFGKMGTEEGQFFDAESIAIDAEGDIWVADTYNGRLQEFDPKGKLIRVVQPPSGKSGHMVNPSGIDIGPSGNVWICDWIAGAIIEFNAEGSFVQEFGTTGIFDGQFMHPDTIEADEAGTIWVVDERNSRVQWFSEKGTYEGKFGSLGSGEGQFSFEFPAGITSDANGNLWIADSLNGRVQKWVR
jgi:sugar lactone lactonase YvrE